MRDAGGEVSIGPRPVLSLLTNPAMIQALQARSATSRDLAEVRQRLSTGLRVATAKDESAAYQISRGMKADISGWEAALDSLARGQALVSITSTGVRAMSDLLIQVREHVMQLAGATDDRERGTLRRAIQDLVRQSDQIAQRSTYMGRSLLTAVPPADTPQPADFLLPLPTAPPSGVLSFTRNAGMTAGRLVFELDLGAGMSEVEIYQGTKRVAATTREMGSGGPARPANGVQVLQFDYDPNNGHGQTLDFHFNQNYAGSNGWRITGLRMEYAPTSVTGAGSLTVLSTPSGDTVSVEDRALLSEALHLRELTTATTDLALIRIESAITAVNAAGAYYGTLEAELERRVAFGMKLRDGLEAQVGAMVDADLSKEGARLNALLARESLATLGVNVANSHTRILLDLFRPAEGAVGSLVETA